MLLMMGMPACADQPTAIPFPGVTNFPTSDLGDNTSLIQKLYNSQKLTTDFDHNPLCLQGCALSVQDRLTFHDADGRTHTGAVIAAQPPDPAHYQGAYL